MQRVEGSAPTQPPPFTLGHQSHVPLACYGLLWLAIPGPWLDVQPSLLFGAVPYPRDCGTASPQCRQTRVST